jgi:photosystem II stability/assembly factor-like uncharacterized protein
MSEASELPEGQDFVYALATSPLFEQDGICFAGHPSGLFRSEDAGLSWTDAYRSLELRASLATAAIAVSPNFGVDRIVFAGVSGGILRSSDGGGTWTVVQLPSPPPFVLAVAVSPDFARDGVVLAATMEDGIFRSGDRGSSWAAWNFGLLDLNVLSLVLSPAFGQDETAFVGTDSGIFRSTNGGRAWREVDSPGDLAPVLSLALSPYYLQDGILWAGTESSGLYCSSDRGRTWTQAGPNAIEGAVNQILLEAGDAGLRALILAGNDLLISRDSGSSWAMWEAELPADRGLTAVTAPLGLGVGTPLLVGFADGTVLRTGKASFRRHRPESDSSLSLSKE